MLPNDTKNLDKLMRGNEPRSRSNVVSFANWSWQPVLGLGKRRS